MVGTTEIDKAIAAHGQWKMRLKGAIATGKSDFSVDKVKVDNGCDFGRWLYSLPASERNSEHCKTIQSLHAEFHKTAAQVLSMALQGDKNGAQAALGLNGDFAAVSSKLTIEMMNWKRALTTA